MLSIRFFFVTFLAISIEARSVGKKANVNYPTVNTDIFTKNLPPKIILSTFDNKTIDRVGAVVEVIVNSTSYFFIADWGNSRIVKTDENGTVLKVQSTGNILHKPVGITASKNYIYYTEAQQAFYQMDFDLNLKQTIKRNTFLETIWYDMNTDLLYIADEGPPPIDSPGYIYVYRVINETNFNLISTITVDTAPYGLMVLLGNLYVGDENNNFIVYNQNKKLRMVENICEELTEQEIWSILADANGSIVFPCAETNEIVLYSNSTQTFSRATTIDSPRGVYLDSKSRLLVGTANHLLIYY